MRRVLLRIAAVATVAVGLPLVWFAPAGAEAPEETAWWFKANQSPASGLLPVKVVPPNVPEGGLYVANDPTGPAGVSALRFYLPDASGATLTLTVDSTATAREASVIACKSASAWLPADGGEWGLRAQPDCGAGQVAGDAGEDGTTMTWELPDTFAAGGTYDVVLLPDPETTEPFQMPFAPPDETAVTPSSGGAVSGPSSAPADFEFSAEDFGTEFAGDTFSAPSGDFSTPPPAGPSVPDSQPGEPQAAAPVEQPQVPLTNTGVSATDPERWIATGVLGAIGLGMWLLAGRQAPAPRLLGGLAVVTAEAEEQVAAARRGVVGRTAKPVIGGIGRFARARTVPPTRM